METPVSWRQEQDLSRQFLKLACVGNDLNHQWIAGCEGHLVIIVVDLHVSSRSGNNILTLAFFLKSETTRMPEI